MPLEALVDPDTGSVIVVKPQGSVWGRCEINAVMLLNDELLQKELVKSGQPHLVHPYAAWEEVESRMGDKSVKRRELRVDSLVKIAVPGIEAMKAVSPKPGILRVIDANAPVRTARIAEVHSTPASSRGGTVIVPSRPLPEVT